MYVFTVLLVVLIILSLYGLIEFYFHQKRIHSIPIRVHINGTRGKSSVTRLIGAALRESGIKTITKVTGTYPRLILEDGSEVGIYRKAGANIIEQLSITRFASKRNAQAIVMECMAVQPQYQWITENKMLHSTLAVITNVRLDHIDVMGYSLPEIATALGNTIPKNQYLLTAEKIVFNKLKEIADKRNCKIQLAEPDLVTEKEMKGFSYIEHKENVALALAVSLHLGIERKTALNGMYKAIPDAGALKLSSVNAFNKKINFYNAFAANDPQSTLMIWEKLRAENELRGIKMILLNTRQDRLDRAKQLTAMVGRELKNQFDNLILIGQSSEIVEELSVSNGVQRNKIINLGWNEPEAVFEAILAYTTEQSTVVAVGNMGGMGGKVADFFENRSVVYG
ncbi:MAG: poly-gamma-glutamate synthase PgsB [Ignavibacteriota bacterium]|jgi:poly-gamma-glutamate synthase PgsB/CapB|nr:MAG: poly-gamma-glutamate synthase PgsB [Chlorobiota bacterium]MBE7475389.1 poly-gamma-glutamate synthase PgsB [Ignavibacteriales bacterium]MBL1122355.1 poly-gamma-glutamate synthase PgsB [Ignavibacteriota bacterium]MBV6419883.1 Capsule biosynthesis protein CapB [Ignavibacteriaceae bacterium]MCE7854989.1 poly-gamma-glutamate synthase PgsB [Ignavibacteria bacterium CHB3]MEB2295162.1 poly-gamma-glutamate synthase PgsB [Ignavibacteria bacterium]